MKNNIKPMILTLIMAFAFIGCTLTSSQESPTIVPVLSDSKVNEVRIRSGFYENDSYDQKISLLSTAKLVRHTFSNGEKISYSNRDGYVINDDIIEMKSSDVVKNILIYEKLLNDKNQLKTLGVGIKKTEICTNYFMFWCLSSFTLDPRWTNRIVYYDFVINMSANQQNLISQFINKWNNTAVSVKWYYSSTAPDRVSFRQTYGNYDCGYGPLGMRGSRFVQGGVIPIGIDFDDSKCPLERTVYHMMGHTVGLLHEELRCDRDKYVKILMYNVQDGHSFLSSCAPPFPPLGNAPSEFMSLRDYGVFNYNSVMLSAPQYLSKDGGQTVQYVSNPPLPYAGNPLNYPFPPNGQTLSYDDILAINEMYR
jgi:Astacin (Peptidase family M12A)